MTQPTDDPAAGAPALSFEGGTGFLLARTGSLARRRWARMLTERGLKPHHYAALMALGERGPLGQQWLSELIGVDPRNTVALIDGLVDRGLLTREIDPGDRRRRQLELTDPGRQTVRDLTRTGADIERDFLRALTPEEQSQLRHALLTLLTDADREH